LKRKPVWSMSPAMTKTLPAQFLPVDGVRNFRDFGGYTSQTGKTGKTVKKGHLFRSGNYTTITKPGLTRFSETNIKVVVDLRRGQERINSPSQLHDLPIETIFSSLGDGDGTTLPPRLQYIRDGDLSVEGCHDHMLSSYRRIPWEPQHGETFLKTFQKLAEGHGPIVIHCAAGKDRTGILCGLILHTLGVSQADIMHDYLLTNAVPLDTPWLNDYATRMSKIVDRPIDPLAILPMMGVHRDFLDLAWDEMVRRHGGLDGYLDHIGVTPTMRTALTQNLLV
jgi:protein-tyrosine phosphatase